MLSDPFTTREAIIAGITPGQLRGKRWRAPFRGVHEPSDAIPSLVSQCHALARVLPPEAVFSGMTVARLLGWWLPRGAERSPLHVTVPPGYVIRRPGVRATRRPLEASEVFEYEGLQLTTGARTLADLAAEWALIDLVVMADSALRFGACSRDELQLLASARGARGVRTLRRASTLADPRSESPMESLVRLVVVLSGLPAPTPPAILLDDAGGWLARVDLLGPDKLTVLEYDGASHDEPERHNSDVVRWRLLHRHGFKVYPYVARDVFCGPVQVVTDYQTSLGLRLDPGAVDGWLREFRQSSFGRRG